MRLAIIGTGIAGNAAAYALATRTGHAITVYERDLRLGGHSATVDVHLNGRTVPVDTGFIVYNELNYPNLTALFASLGVETQASDMSFSVSARGGRFEWAGRTSRVIRGLFAQRSNLLSPGFWRMLLEVLRFNRLAVVDRAAGHLEGRTLGDYLAWRGFSPRFQDDYLLPMGAAIWSMSTSAMLGFPAASFVAFFDNHHLLQWNRPVWRTVTGGSRRYVERLSAAYRDRVKLGTAVTRIERGPQGVDVIDASGHRERFDQVILATHSDQALAMIADPSAEEAAILGAIGYRDNDVYLHRDPALMPKRQDAWAAWNVLQSGDASADLCVTYWMNALQGIDPAFPVFVTLNPPTPPRDDLTFGKFCYAHPQYDEAAIAAQRRLDVIQGANRLWFCGAWTGFGFHEDGLASGLKVAEALGAALPWRAGAIELPEAAE